MERNSRPSRVGLVTKNGGPCLGGGEGREWCFVGSLVDHGESNGDCI